MEQREVRKRARPGQEADAGRTKRGLRIDNDLYDRLTAISRREGTTITDLINRALAKEIKQDTAKQEDAVMAPLIEQLIKDRHGRLEEGLRSLIARVAHEVLRSQYILCSFITKAGVTTTQVGGWRSEGYRWAVKELRRRPDKDVSDSDE